MKFLSIIIIFLFCFISFNLLSQNVGIGTATPDASAKLHINSTTSGLLIPRMTAAQRTAISAPASGLLVFQTDATSGFYYYSGSAWVRLGADGEGWKTTGNTGTVNGTNFIGTTDNQALDIQTNNIIRARITTKGQIEVLNTGQSVFLGEGAGTNDDLTTNKNIFIGYQTGYTNTTGNNNTALGHKALYSNTTGVRNTAIGYETLIANQIGTDITALGYASLYNNKSSANTAIGAWSQYSNITGGQNTSVGYNTLYNNISGSSNNSFGLNSLHDNTTGSFNIAIGNYALRSNQTGSENTCIGNEALYNNAGDKNVVLGRKAGYGNTTGSRNIFIGYNAGYAETGSDKLYIDNSSSTSPLIYGDFAANILRTNGTLQVNDPSVSGYAFPASDGSSGYVLSSNGAGTLSWTNPATLSSSDWSRSGNAGTTNGTNFLGTTDNQSLDIRTNNVIRTRITTKGQIEVLNTGQSVFLGEGAGNSDDLSSNNNVFVGYQAGFTNSTGDYNAAVGTQTMYSSTTAYKNAAVGYKALYNISTGNLNATLGHQSLYNNTTGSRNTGLGYEALFTNQTGNYNVAIGYAALFYSTASFNSAIGSWALYNNTSGNNNVSLGRYSLFQNISGGNNTALGDYALSSNTTGTYNTSIGYNAFSSGTNYTNSTALGYNTTITASNQIHLGNSSVTSIGGQVTWSTYSDERVKTNVLEDVMGLDFILQLRPVSYNYDIDLEQELMTGSIDTNRWEGKYDIEKIRFNGFIAQEVEQAARQVGYSFSGVQHPVNENTLYSLRYAEFVVPLVKGMQEQQAEIEQLKIENEQLKQQNTDILQRLKALENK